MTVAAVTVLLWVPIVRQIGLRPELPAFLAMGAILVVLSVIDIEQRRIPNRILGPAAIAAVVLLSAAAAFSNEADGTTLVRALMGALAYGVPMLGLAIAAPSGMGMGDVKLAAYLGLHLGWLSLVHVVVGAFAGFLVGSLAGLSLMAAQKKGRKETIPFGPSMAVGAFIAVFWGNELIKMWLG